MTCKKSPDTSPAPVAPPVNQAIVTSYRGPTDAHGARYLASAQAGRISVIADQALGNDGNGRAAALALASKLGWGWTAETIRGGGLPDGSIAWVQVREVPLCPPDRFGEVSGSATLPTAQVERVERAIAQGVTRGIRECLAIAQAVEGGPHGSVSTELADKLAREEGR